jgi:hypothetical protein
MRAAAGPPFTSTVKRADDSTDRASGDPDGVLLRVAGRLSSDPHALQKNCSSSIWLQPRKTTFRPSAHLMQRFHTVPAAGEAKGRQRGGDVAGSHPRFLREAPMPSGAPQASRHRYPPRDLASSRTADRWRRHPGLADTPTLPPAQPCGRPLEKTRSRWRRRRAEARLRGERCIWKNPRYKPLRKPATARRLAFPARRIRSVALHPDPR